MIDFVLRNIVELATLPGSVPKLRSFILDQAVRGNLTADWQRDDTRCRPWRAFRLCTPAEVYTVVVRLHSAITRVVQMELYRRNVVR